MRKYLLEILLFSTIITLSFALPPAVDELIEGLEKSLIGRHGPNEKIYSLQLGHALYNAETFLMDQAVEENGQRRIPIYYGTPSDDASAVGTPFVDRPVNLLGLRNPPLEPEKPFAHIVVHKYGFGVIGDKAEEEKIVRAVAVLAVAHRRNPNPEVVAVLNDTSKDAELKEDVVVHRQLVRGLFSNFIGESPREDIGGEINKSVRAIIADHDYRGYMDSLNHLIESSFPDGYRHIPFRMSPYKNSYPVNSLPITERIRNSMNFFPWINNVMVIDAPRLKPPLKVYVPPRTSRSPHRRMDSVDMSLLRQRNVHTPINPSQDVLDTDPVIRTEYEEMEDDSGNRMNTGPADRTGDPSNDLGNAAAAQEASNENSDGNSDDGNEANDMEDDFVNVDNGDTADNEEDDSGSEGWSLFSSPEPTPFRALPPASIVPDLVASIVSDGSSSDTSAIGDSPIRRVMPGEPDPYH